MPYHPDYLRQIIKVALQPLDLWSDEAEELLLMTAAHESHLGEHLLQIPYGPARGLYQMEPATERDIWHTYLYYRPKIASLIGGIAGTVGSDINQLQYNPIYNTIMARLKYRRAPGQLPAPHDLSAMAEYAKAHFNTPAGKATPEEYMLDYRRLVLV